MVSLKPREKCVLRMGQGAALRATEKSTTTESGHISSKRSGQYGGNLL